MLIKISVSLLESVISLKPLCVILQLQNQLEQERIEHEDIKQQIEDDADREIVALRAMYESQLREERDTNVRLRGESGVTKKKLIGY